MSHNLNKLQTNILTDGISNAMMPIGQKIMYEPKKKEISEFKKKAKGVHSENSDNADSRYSNDEETFKGGRRARSRHFDKNGRIKMRSSKKQRNYYSPIQQSNTIDQPSFNYNLERSSAGNTGKTESGGSDYEVVTKKY